MIYAAIAVAITIVATGCRQDKPAQGFLNPTSAQAATTRVSTADAARAKKAPLLYEIPAKLTDRPEQIIKRKGYTTSYNSKTKTPNWVAWHLTKQRTYGSAMRSGMLFTEDTAVEAPRATDKDYYNSRYDRGHLEILCRDWARKYGSIDIVCGPLFDGIGEQKMIGRNRVWVPEKFFKVVLCRQGNPKAIGFIYNNEGKKQPMKDAVSSVDEIETFTGIDFFPALDDKIENRIEAQSDLADW